MRCRQLMSAFGWIIACRTPSTGWLPLCGYNLPLGPLTGWTHAVAGVNRSPARAARPSSAFAYALALILPFGIWTLRGPRDGLFERALDDERPLATARRSDMR
jgi:hypothetical protein